MRRERAAMRVQLKMKRRKEKKNLWLFFLLRRKRERWVRAEPTNRAIRAALMGMSGIGVGMPPTTARVVGGCWAWGLWC
jgi:hypothetical protein